MLCYAIRKRPWMQYIARFDFYYERMMLKFSAFYFTQIFTPVLKLKNRIIEFYDVRRDYEQVLVLRDYNREEMQ